MKSVSVIIPVYNAGDTLHQCINSIGCQTLKDIEIICVDDGSTDRSVQVLHELQEKDSRIRISQQTNQGAAAARNRALAGAEGEYVAFVDADDFLLDASALEKMYRAAKREDVSVCGSFRSMERDGKVVPSDLHRDLVQDTENGRKIAYRDYQYDYHFQSYIYLRQMLVEEQIEFPDYKRFQDPPFFVRAMIAADEFFIVPVEYYCYRCGHDDYRFTDRKVNDIVCGLTDILRLSADAGLKRLHKITVGHFNESYFWDIIEHCTKDNRELLSLLVKADRQVRWEWMDRSDGGMLRPLECLLQVFDDNKSQWKGQFESKHKYGSALPFHRLEPGRKIVLYAAGTVGCAYHEQLKQHGGYELVLWADRNWQGLGVVDGVRIQPAEQILHMEYDNILIALDDHETAMGVIDDLVKRGIDRKKIVWGAM